MIESKERSVVDGTVRPDTYSTLLVHAEPGLAASHRVEVAACLARDLNAHLIGLGAETFEPVALVDPYSGDFAPELVKLLQEQVTERLAAAETAFRRDAAGSDLEWRTVQDFPSRALVRMALTCDLIIVSPKGNGPGTQSVDPGDVVMSAGRPVLIVPPGQQHLQAKSVVVAWKDTRECRRAIDDALPMLQRAEQVIVHAVCKPGDIDPAVSETDDVVANLKRHGVVARPLVTAADPDRVAHEIERVAKANGADLIVAGAYGHGRLREWAFGGVTEEFIHRPPCFVLMTH